MWSSLPTNFKYKPNVNSFRNILDNPKFVEVFTVLVVYKMYCNLLKTQTDNILVILN